jgi:hypothetical protein
MWWNPSGDEVAWSIFNDSGDVVGGAPAPRFASAVVVQVGLLLQALNWRGMPRQDGSMVAAS